MIVSLDVEPLIERIRTQVTALREVEGSGDYEAAWNTQPRATPAAFVLQASESATQVGASTQRIVQKSTVLVGVVYAVKNFRRADLGAAAGTDLKSVRDATRGKVIGYSLASYATPFDLHSGRFMRLSNGVLWWQDVFRAIYRIEV